MINKVGKAEHDKGKHDDLVIAMMFALYIIERFPEVKVNYFKNSASNYYIIIGKKGRGKTEKDT